VASARVDTNVAELRLAPDSDAQAVLAAVVGRLRISHFEIAAPSLEEIFIDRVGAGVVANRPAEVVT
jgi:ABC-type uncharacterized transport system ATPase subunit